RWQRPGGGSSGPVAPRGAPPPPTASAGWSAAAAKPLPSWCSYRLRPGWRRCSPGWCGRGPVRRGTTAPAQLIVGLGVGPAPAVLVVDRTDHPVGRVEPVGVVLGQPGGHVPAGLVAGGPPLSGTPLELPGGVERTGPPVVQGRSGAPPRLDDPPPRADPRPG